MAFTRLLLKCISHLLVYFCKHIATSLLKHLSFALETHTHGSQATTGEAAEKLNRDSVCVSVYLLIYKIYIYISI